MKKWTAASLMMVCLGLQAQTSTDADMLRITTERTRLEAGFTLEDTACYKKFLVNRCLDEVKARRRDALADLQRQEIVLNAEARKVKAADQFQKIEDKSSPEKLRQEADKQVQAAKDFDDRMARDKQKNADRAALQAGEKASAQASAGRVKSNQDKAAARTAKQTGEAEELRKYNERQSLAKERQARYARDKASLTKTPAKPLPAQP